MSTNRRSSLPIIDAPMIESLALKIHPDYTTIERDLVALAREGGLKGVVQKPARYSATTIQWHDECARKYYWPAVAGLEDPPSPAQAFGTELHLHQEHYLKEGKLPPQTKVGLLAMKGHVLLPPPKTPGLRVEDDFLATFVGVPVTVSGQIDFTRDPHNADGPDFAAKGFLLGDHKTKKNRRYPKTKPWLQNNIQSNLYAYVRWGQLAAMGYDQLKVVDKQWIYYFKENDEAEKLRTTDSLDHVAEQFETVIKPNLLGMARMVREVPRIGDVPAADKSVCEAYFGCPHSDRCWGMGAAKEHKNMGVVAGNFSKQNIAAKAQALKTSAPAVAPRAVASAPRMGAGTAINPPTTRQAPPRAAAPVQEEEFEDTGLEQEQQMGEEDAVEIPAAEPARATRKPRASKKTEAQDTQGSVTSTTTNPGRNARTPGSNSAHNFWLFVGCRPEFGFSSEITPIEHLVGGAQADAAPSEVQHYRGANSYGALEAAFAKWMEEHAIVGAVHVDPDTIVARDVVSLLRAHADVIISRSM